MDRRRRVLYCGDTSLESAAAYLAGLMARWDWEFDYVPSQADLASQITEINHDLVILSDYPAHRVSTRLVADLLRCVESGCGLVMLGGWESFRGSGGHWGASELSAALPVQLSSVDDRVNCDYPVLLRPVLPRHEVLAGLPWDERPPLIGGFNRFRPRAGAMVVLEAVPVHVQHCAGRFEFSEQPSEPLLVLGTYGRGRTAAFASDVAPHWIGPMVDWGPQRVTGQASGADSIEVGVCYAQFFIQLLQWCRGDTPAASDRSNSE